MKKLLHKPFLLAALSVMCTFSFAQVTQFQITYGAVNFDWGRAKPASDGGYVMMMEDPTNPSLRDIAIVKLDSAGNMLWSKTYGLTSTNDTYAGFIEAHNGGYLIHGVLNVNTPNQVVILIRTHSNGDTIWVKRNYYGNELIKTNDGGYALVGSNFCKLDSTGNIQSTKIINSSGSTYGIQTNDGGFILGGATNTYSTNGPNDWDITLTKLDSIGNPLWMKVIGTGTNGESGGIVVRTFDGGYAILGQLYNINNLQQSDLMLIKTDVNGNIQWTKTYGGNYYDMPVQLKIVPGGL